MQTNSIIEMSRRRWAAERPLEGHTKDSLFRKLKCPAIREEVRELIRHELQCRAGNPIST